VAVKPLEVYYVEMEEILDEKPSSTLRKGGKKKIRW